MPVAIQETAFGEIWRGCAVMGHDSKSGLFLPWTNDNPETIQCVADILDFTLYEAVKSSMVPAVRDMLGISLASTKPMNAGFASASGFDEKNDN